MSLIVVAFFVLYPVANTHAPGTGSDDDDALNLGALALLTGRFPYSQTTYLGNALHHLPGAFVLAVPFVILGAPVHCRISSGFRSSSSPSGGSRQPDSAAVGVARPRAQSCGDARHHHPHGVCVQHYLRPARLVVACPNEAPGRRGHHVGGHAGVSSQFSLAHTTGIWLPASNRRRANRASGDGAHVCNRRLPHHAILPARSSQFWAARGCQSPSWFSTGFFRTSDSR